MEYWYQTALPYSLIKVHISTSVYKQVFLKPSKHQALEAPGCQNEKISEVTVLTVQDKEEMIETM